jgi:hypothetical protein
VHGRAQQDKEPAALKAEWLDALDTGLGKSGLRLPIGKGDVRFPYYGDTLAQLVAGVPPEVAAAIVVRGETTADDERRFIRSVLLQVQERVGISDAQLAAAVGPEVIERGPLNWEWLQGILRAIDRHVPYGSGASIALFTNDVYNYLRNNAVRQDIEAGVSASLTPGVETVIVGHSLGSVITYNLLRQEGEARGWQVPLYVTVGSPLGVTAIREALKSFATTRCPPCVTRWFNAMDTRDVVALYPLAPQHFPLDPAEPAIDNYTRVRNGTENRHGIGGYLDDERVAREIYEALTV